MSKRVPYVLEVQIFIPMEEKLTDTQKAIKADEMMALADRIEKLAGDECPDGLSVRVFHNIGTGRL